MVVSLAAAMLASMIAGCGGDTGSAGSTADGSTSSSGESAPEAAGTTVEIEFFQQKREVVDSLNAAVEAFQEENPGIVVTQNVVPDAATVLMTRAATNDIPDVMMHGPTDSQFIQFAQQGRLRALDKVGCMDNVMSNYLDAVKFEDGHYCCLPFSCNFMGVFYDVDKFEAAGYESPTMWDELISIAEDIKSKSEVAFMFPDKDTWTLSQLQSNILQGCATPTVLLLAGLQSVPADLYEAATIDGANT